LLIRSGMWLFWPSVCKASSTILKESSCDTRRVVTH
jgi:hypothetical protein